MDRLHSPPPGYAEQPQGWWQHRGLLLALLALAALPVLITDIPPLTDLPGHMGRYRVQLDIDNSAALQSFYTFNWSLIGNLGVDLLMEPLARLIGLEPAVKLIVTLIPPLTVAGFLLVAREVHGRIPPGAFFALPFAYGFPFMFGFVNFALSMALAMLAFGLWLRLARLRQLRLRAVIFVPISAIIWVTHAYGWGTLGVMAFSAELVRQHDRGRGFVESAMRAAMHCLVLAPPLLPMLAWRSGHVGGSTGDWFNMRAKVAWLVMALRDRWFWLDVLSLSAIVTLIAGAMRSKRLGFSRNLAASALFLALVFLLLPRIVFGSAYADMRLVPYMFAVAVLAIRVRDPEDRQFHGRLALAALAFLLIRFGGHAASFWIYDREYDRQLAALDHVPRGARMVSFVGVSCNAPWAMTRLEHLPAMAIVRREAFSNDQWAMAGAQLLGVRYPGARGFVSDPSQLVAPHPCKYEIWRSIGAVFAELPRDRFDYVWMINPPAYRPELTRGLVPVWRSGSSALFRIDHAAPAAAEAP